MRTGRFTTSAGRRGWLVAALAIAGMAQVVIVPVSAASAQGSGGATARAAELAAAITSQARQVRQVNVQYHSALVTLSTIRERAATTRASLSSTTREIAASKATLQSEAVAAFVRIGGEPSQLIDMLSQTPNTYEIGQVYLQVTAGEVDSGIARYQAAQRSFESQSATLAAELSQARSTADHLASLAQSLQVTLASESATLAQVQLLAPLVVADQVNPGAPAPQGLPTESGLVALGSAPPPTLLGSIAGALAALRQCESGGDYAANTGNGYYGAYQFAASTWSSLGLPGVASQASPALQDRAAAELQARSGWGQWPTCAVALGL